MTIKEIKDRLSIVEVLNHYGVQTNAKGMVRCLYHEDKTPSMLVNESKDTLYCFSGNCDHSGKAIDVIDAIMYKESSTKREAIDKAKSLIGSVGGVSMPRKVKPVPKAVDYAKLFESLRKHTHYSKVQAYVESRALNAEALELGYNSGRVCPQMKGCLIFPLKDQAGKVVSFYGRSLGYKSHFYNTGRAGLYPRYPSPETTKLLLTESVIDAATFYQESAITKSYEVLAAYGTNGLTPEHKQALLKLEHLEEIVFCFDGDAAGQKATAAYADYFQKAQPKVKLSKIKLSDGEDVNGIRQGHEASALYHLINTREAIKAPQKAPQQAGTTATSGPEVKIANNYSLYKDEALQIEVLGKLTSKDLSQLKVTLVITNLQEESRLPSRFHLNLYQDEQVDKYLRRAAEKTGLLFTVLCQAVNEITTKLERYRLDQSENKSPEKKLRYPLRELTKAEQEQAVTLLKSKDLAQNLMNLLKDSGVIGEEKNALFLYLILLSHQMPKTLHAMVQGTSGSGKSHLIKKVADCMYNQNKIKRFTRVTDKSFYNYGEHDLKHCGIILEDYDGLSEEAELAWRELQSNQMLSSSVSQKNELTGEIQTGEKYVFGPIASLVATTKFNLYEDNESRVFIVAIDESEEQTERVLEYMADKSSGAISDASEQKSLRILQNISCLLKPYRVKNPYRLKLPNTVKHRRRLTQMLHDFIAQVTLLNQFKRHKTSVSESLTGDAVMLITEVEDLSLAVDLMFNSIVIKSDELDGILRQFYESLKAYIDQKAKHEDLKPHEVQFNQREIRQAFKISKTQCFRYFTQLTELEYLARVGSGMRNTFLFTICYWDNIEKLRTQIKTHLHLQIEALKRLGT